MQKEEAYKIAEKMINDGIEWPKIINVTHLEIGELKKISHQRKLM